MTLGVQQEVLMTRNELLTTTLFFCGLLQFAAGCNNSDGGFYGGILCYGENDVGKLSVDSKLGKVALRVTEGVSLPKSATDIFFCECANRDANQFLIFRCNNADLESFVDELTGERLEDLPTKANPVSALIFENQRVVPERMRKNVAEARNVENARYFSNRFGLNLVIDQERSRVFLYK